MTIEVVKRGVDCLVCGRVCDHEKGCVVKI